MVTKVLAECTQGLPAAVDLAAESLGQRPDVLRVRAGYRVKDGMLTKEPAVVVVVRQKLPLATLHQHGTSPLPMHIEGFTLDVANASFKDVLAAASPPDTCERGHNYTERTAKKFRLDRFSEPMQAIVHLSPDAGWPNLKQFLARTEKRLTVGMYEYSAPHIIEASLELARRLEAMSLVVQKGSNIGQGTKAGDIKDAESVRMLQEAFGDRLEHAWAVLRSAFGRCVNPRGIFDSSYHIKVAVRDRIETWLSSGSWQSSNQPPFDPLNNGDQTPPLLSEYNREWHVIIKNERLANIFEEHLLQDRRDAEAAAGPDALVDLADPEMWIANTSLFMERRRPRVPVRYFEPLQINRALDIRPVLSPDNYLERALELIESATSRDSTIYFQNQTFKTAEPRTAGYTRLLEALLTHQRVGRDVKILFRYGERDDLEAAQDFGFDINNIRIDNLCHTKGIIVDGRVALLGSHNWSNAGASWNRDASIIFHDEEVAEYLQRVFLYDWSRARQAELDEYAPAPRLVQPWETSVPAGMIKVRLSQLDLF
ncbi:phospholipase D-like domain-containing protein [Piscinibacter sp. HJYY11]|uniref:phospholipase D-like domain-containing protein n=1 Tax=Piscinibacter sp. HJYY11 TaxID=2801333 RepID=UPI00191EAE8B|nr:phospholipase D-like domain-containing protein [Piscinibacter sp. HJYY11]MBL0726113.1 hypothetical protein [Piscinibacter sp. HJYY11]